MMPIIAGRSLFEGRSCASCCGGIDRNPDREGGDPLLTRGVPINGPAHDSRAGLAQAVVGGSIGTPTVREGPLADARGSDKRPTNPSGPTDRLTCVPAPA